MSMTNEPERFHLLLLASEQIQPNLMVALSLWQTGRLASLAILHTDDRTRSAEPARQIQKLVRAICLPPPGCPPVRAETYRVDFRPQSVVERILGLLAAVFVKIVVALGDQAACILSERCKLSETMTSRSGLRVTVSR